MKANDKVLVAGAATALVFGLLGGLAVGASNAPIPKACIQALHDADTLNGLAGMALGYASDAIGGDYWTAARNLDRLQPKVDATMASYNTNKENCK